MITPKYVVGDVVIVDGKQKIIFVVDPGTSYSLYGDDNAMYKLNDGEWYGEDELGGV